MTTGRKHLKKNIIYDPRSIKVPRNDLTAYTNSFELPRQKSTRKEMTLQQQSWEITLAITQILKGDEVALGETITKLKRNSFS